jgi:hypothetical protein
MRLRRFLFDLRTYFAQFRPAGETPSIVRIEGSETKDVSITGSSLQMNDQTLGVPFVGIEVFEGRGVQVAGNAITNNNPNNAHDTGVRIGSNVSESSVSNNICHTSAADVVAPDAAEVFVHRYNTMP